MLQESFVNFLQENNVSIAQQEVSLSTQETPFATTALLTPAPAPIGQNHTTDVPTQADVSSQDAVVLHYSAYIKRLDDDFTSVQDESINQ